MPPGELLSSIPQLSQVCLWRNNCLHPAHLHPAEAPHSGVDSVKSSVTGVKEAVLALLRVGGGRQHLVHSRSTEFERGRTQPFGGRSVLWGEEKE